MAVPNFVKQIQICLLVKNLMIRVTQSVAITATTPPLSPVLPAIFDGHEFSIDDGESKIDHEGFWLG